LRDRRSAAPTVATVEWACRRETEGEKGDSVLYEEKNYAVPFSFPERPERLVAVEEALSRSSVKLNGEGVISAADTGGPPSLVKFQNIDFKELEAGGKTR
jgi:hypothetical protein